MGIECKYNGQHRYVNLKKVLVQGDSKPAEVFGFVYESKEERDHDGIPCETISFPFIYDLASSENVFQQAYAELKMNEQFTECEDI